MARNYDSIDWDFTWDGDLARDSSGDILDTSTDMLLSLRNEIFTIVKSDLGDWREESSVGSDLGDFVGESNTKDTAIAIQERVSNSLTIICSSNDINVRVIPTGTHKVLINIQVQVLATQQNGLKSGDTLLVSFLYDYFERGTFVPLEEMHKFNSRNI